MKAVLMSIQPKWCELIASGKKTVEVRKTRPKNDVPFKCYIYCTKQFYRQGDGYFQGKHCGKVIAEFICDNIREYESEFVDDDCFEMIASIDRDEDGDATGFFEWSNDSDIPYISTDFYQKCCVTYEELKKYMGLGFATFYGWHISDLVIYDKPKELSEFNYYNCTVKTEDGFPMPTHHITRPPQSWCYVVKDGDE